MLAADGVDVRGVDRFIKAMRKRGAIPEVLAPIAGGSLSGGSGGENAVDRSFTSVASVLYDAVVVPCGPHAMETLEKNGYAVHFVTEAYKHLKAVAAFGAGIDLLRKAGIDQPLADGQDVVAAAGVVSTTAAQDDLSDQFFEEFAAALAKHRPGGAKQTRCQPDSAFSEPSKVAGRQTGDGSPPV
ncbi:DJ-1/PfpI family protein [Candidatus Mycobacterium methanotrophicum]|uniref:catalase n=1 Tax=Candidatus Mycobacterium methanotrophicum TaxID=2943498 RepID=A0ABY4QIX8_9MYCO|nr:DJ-1/PfpI family protein [Candidatus Mycobacterium methanotrophicum]UQX10298.1 DJ-1/PfpI family protein [Candidatus Mycobacterium methanotrophicum]